MNHAWIATVCAPEDAPVHVIAGSLYHAGGFVPLPDHRVARNGWGRRGASHLVGERLRPAPVSLALRWFSFVEDRFYEGRFELPTARIEGLFAQGLVHPVDRSRIGWDSLVVGMAPGGAVAIWLAAGATTVEVATFRAQPVDLPWTEVIDNPARSRSDHVREELARPIVGAAPGAMVEAPGLHTWLRRHARRPLQVEVVGTKARALQLRYWNGEVEPFLVPGAAPPMPTRGAPSEVHLDWLDAQAVPRGAIFQLREAEVFRALDLIGDRQPPQALTLLLRIDRDDPEPRLAFRGRNAALRLRDSVVRVFRRPR